MIRLPCGNEKYEVRLMGLLVAPKGEPIFSETATLIQLSDEAGCEFVNVKQQVGCPGADEKIAIDPREWPVLRSAIDLMVSECRVQK